MPETPLGRVFFWRGGRAEPIPRRRLKPRTARASAWVPGGGRGRMPDTAGACGQLGQGCPGSADHCFISFRSAGSLNVLATSFASKPARRAWRMPHRITSSPRVE